MRCAGFFPQFYIFLIKNLQCVVKYFLQKDAQKYTKYMKLVAAVERKKKPSSSDILLNRKKTTKINILHLDMHINMKEYEYENTN